MSNMFAIDFDSDSESENQQITEITEMAHPVENKSFAVKESQSGIMKSNQKKNDKYVSNQISKNILFDQDDDYYTNQHESEQSQISQSVVEPSKKQTTQKKSVRRVKVDSGIKLQPLKNLELTKKTQGISLIKQPALNKTQSIPQNSQPTRFEQSNLGLTSSVQKQKVLNFQMRSSSDEQQNQVQKDNFKTPNKNFSKLNLELSANVFFQSSDQQKNPDEKQSQQKDTNQQKQDKNNKTLRKQISIQKKNVKKSQQGQEQKIGSKYGQNEQQQQSDSEEAKINFEQEPNSEMAKKQLNQPNVLNSQQQTLNRGFQQRSQLDSLKSLLLNDLANNSVLNLKLRRKQSLLGLFGPQFRIEFQQDKYFLMNSKKTSSKPSSTFTFSASQANYDQSSKKFLGKMKSNIGGSVYNIFGPGLNPYDAKCRNIPPRQLLATVSYRTQFMGTTRPKQLVVFVKKPEYLYYRDFRGVRMYDDEIPLSELYEKFPQNRQKMFIFQTRRPVYHPETREYVMNFEGKVKVSSVKNFILQDRQNNSQKVMLFGKVTQNDFVLDIHSPLTPIVGIGVALTMFDTRIGSQ